jgi:putative transposase
MPNYRRLFQPGGTFFFTLVTCDRHRLFADEFARECLREAIRLAQEEFVPLRVVRLRLIEQEIGRASCRERV